MLTATHSQNHERSTAPAAETVAAEPVSAIGPSRRQLLLAWRDQLTSREPQEMVFQGLQLLSQRLLFCTSFQAEGMVLLDMAWRAWQRGAPRPRVITLDTGRLPEATYDLIEQVRQRYGFEIEIHTPEPQAVAALLAAHGPNLFRQSNELRRACCRVRKVEPLRRALSTADAWVVGLRRGQGGGRHDLAAVALDPQGEGLLKLSPLAAWTWDDVWTYLRLHEVPYHRFYDQGYTSIGCAPCTRPVRPWEELRAGRWWWEAGTTGRECGLHVTPEGGSASGPEVGP